MPRGVPVPPDERARVRELHAQGKSRNDIARETGLSTASVSRIAKSFGLSFDREQIKAATEAKVADTRARRALRSAELLDDISRLRERAWSPYSYYERSEDGPVKVTLDLPPLSEVRNAYVSIGVCWDKHLAQDKHDAGGDSGQMAGLLTALLGDLQARHGAAPQ